VFVLLGFLGFFFVLAPAAIYLFIKLAPRRYPEFIAFAAAPPPAANDPATERSDKARTD
jgi:hypothetical protein